MRTRRSICRSLCMGVVRLVLRVRSLPFLNRPFRALAVFLLMARLPVRALLALEQIRIQALLYLVLMPVLVIRDWILLSARIPARALLALVFLLALVLHPALLFHPVMAQLLIPVVHVVVVFVYMGVPQRAWFHSSLSDILRFLKNNVQMSLMFKNLILLGA